MCLKLHVSFFMLLQSVIQSVCRCYQRNSIVIYDTNFEKDTFYVKIVFDCMYRYI